MVKNFMNNLRSVMGKEAKIYKPSIVIDKADYKSYANGENLYIWTNDAEYLFREMKKEMKKFIDSFNYVSIKSDKANEDKASFIEYSFSNMNVKDVQKIWNKLCNIMSDINDKLGTCKLDLSKIPNKHNNTLISLFDTDSNSNCKTSWTWYRIEIQADKHGNNTCVKLGYHFYPAIFFINNVN
jgi:hypothetical protein